MNIQQVINKIYDELGVKLNRSKIHHYDAVGLCSLDRKDNGDREISEYNYNKLKCIVAITEPKLTLKQIQNILNYKMNKPLLKRFIVVREKTNGWLKNTI